MTRIVLIHALEESVVPSRTAFSTLWKEARCFDLLDTSLAVDLAERGSLDDELISRFLRLGDYASQAVGASGKAAGILFTCSAFGPAVDAVKARLTIPVLRPNEAAFQMALQKGDRIGLIVSFLPSAKALENEFKVMADSLGRNVAIHTELAEGALAGLKSGDTELHDRAVVEAALRFPEVDAIVLGQFSMARAADNVRGHVHVPVLTTPDCAVELLRAQILGSCGGVAA